jgi:methyltransferase (TIGR00027 family)
MALQRSFESHRPAGVRLFADPLADAFLRPSWRLLAAASGVPGLRQAALSLYDQVGGRGPRPSAIVRTKMIDDALDELLADRDQCVLLGAGYDTRAHRLASLFGRPVFEVDHPATQAAKRAVVERLSAGDENVIYVPVDFERDDLADALSGAGFVPGRASVFVWEGVMQYLTAGAVGSTLDVVRALAGGDGALIATYVDRRALSQPSPFSEARRWLQAVARVGEPWIFGLLPEEAPSFFAGHGFVLLSDLSTLDASPGYLGDRSARHWGSGLYRVAVARSDGLTTA